MHIRCACTHTYAHTQLDDMLVNDSIQNWYPFYIFRLGVQDFMIMSKMLTS